MGLGADLQGWHRPQARAPIISVTAADLAVMAATLANGAQLGCLLFPEQRLGLGHEVLLGALPIDDMDLVLRPQLQRVDVGPRVPTPPNLNPMPPPGR